MPKIIKSITPVPCPSCGTVIHVCQSLLQPTLSWVITDAEMQDNKRQLKELLKSEIFKTKKAEEETMKWIDSDECVLGAEDIENVAKEIINEQKE